MSGFFAIRRTTFHKVASRLRPRGFKVLMEILAREPEARVVEVPYTFSPRWTGRSKLGPEVMLDYLWSLVELRTGRTLSPRFLQYCVVGLTGVLVQLAVLAALRTVLEEAIALALAILSAMTSNFVINNRWTFRDRRLESGAWRGGLLRFVAISSLGALINHSVSLRLHHLTGIDLLWTSLAGIVLATVWNYHFNRGFTWGMWERPE